MMALRMKLFCEETPIVTERITFRFAAPGARAVCLVGDFNNWNPTTHPMHRQGDGVWCLQVPLSRSCHYYQFLVDGKPMLDPEAMCSVCVSGRIKLTRLGSLPVTSN